MDLEKNKTILSKQVVTNAIIVIDYQPQNKDPNVARIIVGGNLIKYPFELATRTTYITKSNVIWNSTSSTRCAKYMGAYTGNVYLAKPMDDPE